MYVVLSVQLYIITIQLYIIFYVLPFNIDLNKHNDLKTFYLN